MPGHFANAIGITDFSIGARLEKTVGVGMQIIDIYYHKDIEIELVGYPTRIKTEVGFIDSGSQMHMPLLGRTFFRAFKSVSFEEKN